MVCGQQFDEVLQIKSQISPHSQGEEAMTKSSLERTREIVCSHIDRHPGAKTTEYIAWCGGWEDLDNAIVTALDEARAEEQEACARVAEEWKSEMTFTKPPSGKEIAKAIRARGEKE